jgi:hypothetical protein
MPLRRRSNVRVCAKMWWLLRSGLSPLLAMNRPPATRNQFLLYPRKRTFS